MKDVAPKGVEAKLMNSKGQVREGFATRSGLRKGPNTSQALDLSLLCVLGEAVEMQTLSSSPPPPQPNPASSPPSIGHTLTLLSGSTYSSNPHPSPHMGKGKAEVVPAVGKLWGALRAGFRNAHANFSLSLLIILETCLELLNKTVTPSQDSCIFSPQYSSHLTHLMLLFPHGRHDAH